MRRPPWGALAMVVGLGLLSYLAFRVFMYRGVEPETDPMFQPDSHRVVHNPMMNLGHADGG